MKWILPIAIALVVITYFLLKTKESQDTGEPTAAVPSQENTTAPQPQETFLIDHELTESPPTQTKIETGTAKPMTVQETKKHFTIAARQSRHCKRTLKKLEEDLGETRDFSSVEGRALLSRLRNQEIIPSSQQTFFKAMQDLPPKDVPFERAGMMEVVKASDCDVSRHSSLIGSLLEKTSPKDPSAREIQSLALEFAKRNVLEPAPIAHPLQALATLEKMEQEKLIPENFRDEIRKLKTLAHQTRSKIQEDGAYCSSHPNECMPGWSEVKQSQILRERTLVLIRQIEGKI